MYADISVKKQTILEVLSGKKQYIIPPYQRSYLWGTQECSELWFDLKSAFEEKKEGYFLGNLVLANSYSDRNELEVIDGQQRLISLTLLIYVLFLFDCENKDLEEAITIPANRRDRDGTRRLKTNVFIDKDAKSLREALALNKDNYCELLEKKTRCCRNRFIVNTLYLFKNVKELKGGGELEKFVDFLLEKVWILPIQAEAVDTHEARYSAIEIFETINNRGLNLSDSDILKAKLYSKALDVEKHESFIEEWNNLGEECEGLDKAIFNVGKKKDESIESIFRVYYYIIRARAEVSGPEIKLRTLFNEYYSPFHTLSHQEILGEMMTILEAVKFFEAVVKHPKQYGEMSKWFQLINECKNQYPYLTMMVYLFKYIPYGLEVSDELISFSKKLVAYVYFNGGETKDIRNGLLQSMPKVYHQKDNEFPYYPSSVDANDFEYFGRLKNGFKYFGRLKNGFSLLSFYLQTNQEAIYPYHFSQIVHQKHIGELNASWIEHPFPDYAERLGNLLVLEMPIRRYIKLDDKMKLMQKSSLLSIQDLSKEVSDWSYENYQDRDNALRDLLCKFFTKVASSAKNEN